MSCTLDDFDWDNCCTDNESMEFDLEGMPERERRRQELHTYTDAVLEDIYRNDPDQCERAMALKELELRHGPRAPPGGDRRPACGDM